MAARVLLLAIVVFGPLQPPAAPRKGGNPEAAKIRNPVARTAESIAAGKRSYQRLCAKCHGPEGKGDGTATTKTEPSDLTGTKWDYGSSDGEIFSVVHDGITVDMEPYSSRISDQDIWNLVNYLRTLRSEKF
jgi:mono/diheme cytochrome c family protein